MGALIKGEISGEGSQLRSPVKELDPKVKETEYETLEER